jgi:hypothetical protein
MHLRADVPLAAALIMLAVTTCSGPIGEWRSRIIVAPLYRPPSAATLKQIQELFGRTLANSIAPATVESWRAMDFVAVWRGGTDDPYLSLAEPMERIEGKGRYLLRPGASVQVAVQAPHADTDLLTGEIAERLFFEIPVVAATFNTLPRWAVDRNGRPADLARRPDSVFATFVYSFIRHYGAGAVVQLHGFDTAKRETLAGATADIILSGGTREPDRELVAVRDCLEALSPGRVRLYPEEVTELGGTANVTGRAVREVGAGRFLHVEMSLPFRRRLLSEKQLRLGFAHCISSHRGA